MACSVRHGLVGLLVALFIALPLLLMRPFKIGLMDLIFETLS